MPYAVLQTDLDKPNVEELRRAARSVPGLTPADAHILGNDAFGILVRGFSEQQAAALQGALRVEGVETELVEQTLLPPLPEIRFVHRLDCTPEHLLIYDPLGKNFPLEWRYVMFVAVGSVRLTDFVQKKRPGTRYHGDDDVTVDMEYETVSREERNFHLLGEIIITGAALRYTMTADKFNFAGLGRRQTKSITENFSLLFRDIIEFAANAALNRGADAIRTGASEIFSYPSKNAFYEEIVWTLWQLRKLA